MDPPCCARCATWWIHATSKGTVNLLFEKQGVQEHLKTNGDKGTAGGTTGNDTPDFCRFLGEKPAE